MQEKSGQEVLGKLSKTQEYCKVQMGKCAETVRRKRKCHNCGATEMEKAKNRDGKEEANKSRQSIFS